MRGGLHGPEGQAHRLLQPCSAQGGQGRASLAARKIFKFEAEAATSISLQELLTLCASLSLIARPSDCHYRCPSDNELVPEASESPHLPSAWRSGPSLPCLHADCIICQVQHLLF